MAHSIRKNLLGGLPFRFWFWKGWAPLFHSKISHRALRLAGGQFDFVEDKRERRYLVVEDNTDEGRVDVETFIAVFNEAEFPEFVHEKIHPRPRGPNHFSEHLL